MHGGLLDDSNAAICDMILIISYHVQGHSEVDANFMILYKNMTALAVIDSTCQFQGPSCTQVWGGHILYQTVPVDVSTQVGLGTG